MTSLERPMDPPNRGAILGLMAALLFVPACAPKIVTDPEMLPPFSELSVRCAKWMEGSFTNESQVKDDASFPSAWLHQVRIWSDRSDGIWFYSEETQDGNTQSPLHQFVYRLTDDVGGGLLIETYNLPGNVLRFAGSWRTPRDFKKVDPFNLSLFAGCGIRIERQTDGSFAGGTKGTSCATTEHGAAYLTESITFRSLEITQWTRGYDAYGKQVFGSKVGPTFFDRTNAAAPPESIKPGSGHVPDIGPYTPKG